MDFTIKQYIKLIKSLQTAGFFFQTFSEYLFSPNENVIILRHDVDLLPQNSLQTARIENDFGIKGSYFFRAVPESWDEKIIKEIASLGHEIGYHYENLTTCNGNISEAIKDFKTNLEKLRRLAFVTTICMHGSPRSKYDSKDLWKKYNYKDFGIIGEPYFDIDFSKVLYLTDTGRMWDGDKFNVRDKPVESVRSREKGVRSKERGNSKDEETEGLREGEVKVRKSEGATGRKNERENRGSLPLNLKYCFHSTNDIISAAEKGHPERSRRMPDKIMMTFHPQRWHDRWVPWVKELMWQSVKNQGKRVLIYIRKK
jgi:hypothetical protein